MSSITVNGKQPLSFALSACETMMRTYTPQNLPPAGRFYYHQGVFLSGMHEVYKLTGDKRLFDYIKAWVDLNINPYGDIEEFNPGQLDYLQPGVLLFPLHTATGDPRYKSAMDTILWFYEHFPKNQRGGFWHNAMGRDQMWLDGLYMAGPYLSQYAKTFDRSDLLDVVTLQATLMEQLTRDPSTGLLYHAVDLQKRHAWADPKTGCSPEFWGRAMGWVPVALLNEMEHMDGANRDTLARITRDLLTVLLPYQDDASGLWYQVVDKGDQPGNWLETSCSCLFTAALYKAVRLGVMPSTAMQPAEKAMHGIVSRLEYDGNNLLIHDISEGTWIGDYAFYCNRKRCTNDLHGVGAFLLMCTEAEQMGMRP